MIEAEFLHDARPEIFDDDIGRQGELARCSEAICILQIQHNGTLVAIYRCEILAVAVEHRRPCPHEIPVGRLDFNDIGAHIGEEATAEWTCQYLAELYDFDAGERKHGNELRNARRGNSEISRALKPQELYTSTPFSAHTMRGEPAAWNNRMLGRRVIIDYQTKKGSEISPCTVLSQRGLAAGERRAQLRRFMRHCTAHADIGHLRWLLRPVRRHHSM